MSFFTNKLIHSAKLSTPRKKNFSNKTKTNPVPWWDNSCNKIKRLRKATFKKWEFTGDFNDLIKYKKTCKEAKFKKKRREKTF